MKAAFAGRVECPVVVRGGVQHPRLDVGDIGPVTVPSDFQARRREAKNDTPWLGSVASFMGASSMVSPCASISSGNTTTVKGASSGYGSLPA